jgi:4-hydroxyphenylpyruvate dioxygenase
MIRNVPALRNCLDHRIIAFMTTHAPPRPATAPALPDVMPVHGIDHLELFVGNAAQAAYYYTHAYGFTETAYRGLETGSRDHVSRVLEQGRIRLVLTGSLTGRDEIAEHHKRHGDGVRSIALSVPDATAAYELAVAHGARGIETPYELSDEHGTVTLASVATYGETRHLFVARNGYQGPFLPGFQARGVAPKGPDGLLVGIDHVVGNVELGHMNEWVGYYERVFGMTELIHFSDQAISTEYSALMSKVLTDGSGRIKFPINEPAAGKRKSQIEEYLDFYRGAGVQHIAVSTTDIVKTVDELSRRGVEFLSIPGSYYAEVPERIGEIKEDVADLRRLGILVDRDDEGYLLQIFTKAVGDRPTVFFELIERHGARGFGEGNFKALFQALEREQDKRGNL